MKMTIDRAAELIVPFENGTAMDISPAWSARMKEALTFILDHGEEKDCPFWIDENFPTCHLDKNQNCSKCPCVIIISQKVV